MDKKEIFRLEAELIKNQSSQREKTNIKADRVTRNTQMNRQNPNISNSSDYTEITKTIISNNNTNNTSNIMNSSQVQIIPQNNSSNIDKHTNIPINQNMNDFKYKAVNELDSDNYNYNNNKSSDNNKGKTYENRYSDLSQNYKENKIEFEGKDKLNYGYNVSKPLNEKNYSPKSVSYTNIYKSKNEIIEGRDNQGNLGVGMNNIGYSTNIGAREFQNELKEKEKNQDKSMNLNVNMRNEDTKNEPMFKYSNYKADNIDVNNTNHNHNVNNNIGSNNNDISNKYKSYMEREFKDNHSDISIHSEQPYKIKGTSTNNNDYLSMYEPNSNKFKENYSSTLSKTPNNNYNKIDFAEKLNSTVTGLSNDKYSSSFLPTEQSSKMKFQGDYKENDLKKENYSGSLHSSKAFMNTDYAKLKDNSKIENYEKMEKMQKYDEKTNID